MKKCLKRNISKKANTPHGVGMIVGIDLPESRANRYIVKIADEDLENHLPYFSGRYCYFPHEMIILER